MFSPVMLFARLYVSVLVPCFVAFCLTRHEQRVAWHVTLCSDPWRPALSSHVFPFCPGACHRKSNHTLRWSWSKITAPFIVLWWAIPAEPFQIFCTFYAGVTWDEELQISQGTQERWYQCTEYNQIACLLLYGNYTELHYGVVNKILNHLKSYIHPSTFSQLEISLTHSKQLHWSVGDNAWMANKGITCSWH